MTNVSLSLLRDLGALQAFFLIQFLKSLFTTFYQAVCQDQLEFKGVGEYADLSIDNIHAQWKEIDDG